MAAQVVAPGIAVDRREDRQRRRQHEVHGEKELRIAPGHVPDEIGGIAVEGGARPAVQRAELPVEIGEARERREKALRQGHHHHVAGEAAGAADPAVFVPVFRPAGKRFPEAAEGLVRLVLPARGERREIPPVPVGESPGGPAVVQVGVIFQHVPEEAVGEARLARPAGGKIVEQEERQAVEGGGNAVVKPEGVVRPDGAAPFPGGRDVRILRFKGLERPGELPQAEREIRRQSVGHGYPSFFRFLSLYKIFCRKSPARRRLPWPDRKMMKKFMDVR